MPLFSFVVNNFGILRTFTFQQLKKCYIGKDSYRFLMKSKILLSSLVLNPKRRSTYFVRFLHIIFLVLTLEGSYLYRLLLPNNYSF